MSITPLEAAGLVSTSEMRRFHVVPDTQDRSALLEEIEARKETLRKNHHGQDCIVCFELECVCKPRS